MPYADLENPQSLNLYAYVGNHPLSKVDKDGHGCPPDCTDAINFIVGAANAWGSDNLLGAGRVNQITSAGQLGAAVGDFAAAVQGGAQVVVGTGGNIVGAALDATGVGVVAGVPVNVVSTAVTAEGAGAAVEGVRHLAMGALSNSPTGKGSVPPDQRDPKRTATPSEESKKLAEQGGKCANCDKPVKNGEGVGHHYPDRHADGGKDTVVVCKDCHKDLHSGQN